LIDELCREVIDALSIERFVETGLYQGETLARVAVWFAQRHPVEFGDIQAFVRPGHTGPNAWNTPIVYPVMAPSERGRYRVCSVEIDPGRAQAVASLIGFDNPNVTVHVGSSEAFLREHVTSELGERCFFYLDAHWGDYWPLRDEIAAIRSGTQKSIVCIDDFVVPGHPQCGFDIYNGSPCGWDTVADLYSDRKPIVYYPTRPNRDQRGWVLIFDGYAEGELAFIEKMPDLFRADI
jgi:hypothetical protein